MNKVIFSVIFLLMVRNVQADFIQIPNYTGVVSSVYFQNNLEGYAGGKGYIWKTVDGGVSWNQYPTGYITSKVTDIKFSDMSTGFCVIGGYMLFKTTNAGANWTQIMNVNPQYIVVRSSLEIYCIGQNILYKTLNGGSNWQQILVSSIYNSYTHVSGLVEVNNTLYASFYNTHYYNSWTCKSTNNGLNWVDNTAYGDHYFYHLFSTGNKLFTGGMYIYSGVESKDSIELGLDTEGNGTFRFYSVPDPMHYHGDFTGVRLITNGYGFSTCYLSFTPMETYILKTTDYGINWSPDTTITGVYINNLFNIGNTLYGGCNGGKIFRKDVVIGIREISGIVPKRFNLKQNYPNPFNPETNIEFDIPEKQYVRLIVYDVIGDAVATLVNQNMNIGKFLITWNASKFSSGIFFYKLETESYTESKKMILLK